MRNGRGVGGFVQSRWLYVLVALILVASGRASAADHGRSAAHRPAATAPSSEGTPIVVTDPRNGAVVKIWSRGDADSAKLAWARLNGSGWGHPHDLTFGFGVDRDPAVGLTSAGAWLFWRSDGGVFYAPLEIGSGRLLGVPAPLLAGAVGGGGGVRPGMPGVTPGIEGGMDAPVLGRNCPDDDPVCIATRNGAPGTSNPGGPSAPPVVGSEGGLDTPVTNGASTGTIVVVSDPSCDRQIVAISQGGDSLLVMEVDGAGRVSGRTLVTLDPGVSAEQAGGYFLLNSCTP